MLAPPSWTPSSRGAPCASRTEAMIASRTSRSYCATPVDYTLTPTQLSRCAKHGPHEHRARPTQTSRRASPTAFPSTFFPVRGPASLTPGGWLPFSSRHVSLSLGGVSLKLEIKETSSKPKKAVRLIWNLNTAGYNLIKTILEGTSWRNLETLKRRRSRRPQSSR